MTRRAMSRDFVAFIPCAIESDWDDIWAPRLAGFPVNVCYAESIQGAGVACATYVFDPGTFVDGAQSRCDTARRSTATSRSWLCTIQREGWKQSSTAGQS
jgi:hypothetical protein